jgi:amino acid adenylation domain-containing protein
LPDERQQFALSLSQRNILSLEQIYAGTAINIISATVRISGRVDFTLLSKALNLVLERDRGLRTRIVRADGGDAQEFAPFEKEQFPVYDFSLTDPDGFSQWESALAREPMQLYGAPLCRFFLFRTGEEEGGVLVKTHHIIFDGWSELLLCNRIAKTYLSLLSGKEPELDEAPDYSAHVRQEQEYLDSGACRKDESYWREKLSAPAEPASFKDQRGTGISPVSRRLSYRLPEILNHAIDSFCREHRVSPFAPYYMALAIAARRMGCGRRMTVGVPIHNRVDMAARQTTGMFVSTLPLVMELDENWTAEEFSDALTENWLDLLRHQRYPFERIEALPRPVGGRLFNIALSYQDNLQYRGESATVHFSGRWNFSGYQAEQLCIHLTNLEDHRRYTVDYDYLTQLFTDGEIDRLHHTVCSVLDQILSRPDRPIREAHVISPQERELVLYSFNRTERALPYRGVWETFAARAAEWPTRAAVIENGEKLTYGALCAGALSGGAAIAERLRGDEPLAAVLLPRGNELACALMSVAAAGAAWLLLTPDMPQGRLEEILSTSNAELVVTSRDILASFGGRVPVPVIFTDELRSGSADGFVPPHRDAEGLCYVVYTSGSTGTPKGVEISRGSLLNFAQGMKSIFPDGAMLSVSSVSFDAFVLECAVSLLNGLTVVFADAGQQEDPDALSALLTGFGVDYMCMTPSRLETYLEYPSFRAALAGRKGILCGGETFSGELLARLKALTEAHIYNQYGPSETTVGVSTASLDRCAEITAGRPMPNCRLYVLDDRREPVPVGVFGELYIGGACVGRGYRNDEELTRKAFMADPFVSDGMMYRSGDVACWTNDGQLRLRGRVDRQIKLRGQRVEPDELRFCLENHPAVRKAAVRAAEQYGQTMLCAYFVPSGEVSERELMEYLADKLPVYLLPSRIIRLPAMPMTASGKVDENALPLPEVSLGGEPENDMQLKILSVFRQVLGCPELGADGDYFLFGGNSLNAMETVGLLEPVTGRRLKVSELYACRTARRLEQWLSDGERAEAAPGPAPIVRAPESETYPLSEIQRSIYIQCRMAPDGMAYHMPGAFLLSAAPDRQRLERAFRALIAQDDIYRTAFGFENGKLSARILPQVSFELPELSGDCLETVWKEFLRPFDLERPPFVRAALWKSENGWVLLMDVHHIVGDGVSTPVMLRRLNGFYAGETAEELPLTYKDYAVWRESLPDDDAVAAWKERLTPLPPPLDMPADLPRPHPFDFRGGMCRFTLPDELEAKCDEFCRARELTPFMLFAAAYGLLLSRASGREELITGVPVSGRSRSELWDICGPFLTSLPLRLAPRAESTADEYLRDVRRETLWMLDHQELPLDRVLTELGLPRTFGENPLFQTMFTYRPLDAETLELAGGPLTALETPHDTAKAELSLEAAKTGGRYCFEFEYAASVFQRPTIEFYARSMVRAVAALIAAPDEKLSGLDIVPPEDRIRLLEEPRQMTSPFRNVSVDVLIAEQAARTPDAPAVIFRGETVSFRALEERAVCLAGKLQAAGAAPGGRIGLCCLRGSDIFAGMLAILKNGCAYVPFLPDFPRQRVEYMLETAKAGTVLCDAANAPLVSSLSGVTPVIMDGGEARFAPPERRGGLMYILFTSGSTGRPKGVMVSNTAAANYCVSMGEILRRDTGRVLCVTNMTFDIFLAEGLLPLSMGRTVVMADEEERTLPWRMARCMTASGATTMQITPSQLGMCLGNAEFRDAVREIKLLLLAGEATGAKLVEEASKATRAELVDVYGPTEATVYVSSSRLEPGKPVTIGTPFRNCRMYVLDGDGRDAFPTARGELYLAGTCLAEGYVGRPDLTAAAFVPDPGFPGENMYRTGDMARLKADGEIDCLGRLDAQIKLNGLRIELDEINGAALDSGAVTQCVTVPAERADGSAFLRAFAVPAPGGENVEDNLRRHMRTLLPEYMIPAEIVLLGALPSNPSGKVDLPRLKAWAPEKSAVKVCETVPEKPTELAAPAPEAQPPAGRADAETLRNIWKEELGRSEIADGESFFSQGGTSLAALSVLTKYYSAGINMTLAEFYANPTLAQQADMFCAGTEAAAAARTPAAPSDPMEFRPRPAPSAPPAAPSLPAERVLVTGASGFLGVHILRELLENGLAGEVVCLMRDDRREKLDSALGCYFGPEFAEKYRGRIKTVRGDVTKTRFGMSGGEYDALRAGVSAVYHTAADVRHFASDSKAWTTNVFGTAHTAQFALDSGAALNHISTLSVSGEYLVRDPSMTAVFTESDFYIGQNWHDNIYVEGKFLAEQEVYDRVKSGLNARVFRLGRLTGRDADGVFQKNPASNAVYLTLRGIQAAGALPEAMAGVPIDLTPVDFCARAITALSNGDMPVCHIADPEPVTLLEAARAVDPDIEVLSNETFSARLARLLPEDGEGYLPPLVEIWNRGMHDGPARITQSWDRTTGALVKLGVELPKSPPEVRLREYSISKRAGGADK